MRVCHLIVLSAVGLPALALAQTTAEDKPQQPSSGVIVKEGKILVVRGLSGGEPQLTDEGNQRFLIVGELHEEALRLEGHKLKVWATLGGKKLTVPTLDVKRYEILDSGGHRPHVGLLRRDAPLTFSLDRKEGTPLLVKAPQALLQKLDAHVGCKVWLVGETEGNAIKAFKYGWISCKKTKIKTKEKKR
jgi:hypothetical protein